MIGTFWNLCRACPSIPIDKNRSEYRSTYQWYEYTGPRQEIVKQAPQPTAPTKTEENGLKGGIHAMLININKKDGGKRLKDNAIDGNVKPEVHIKQNPIFDKKEIGLDSTDCAEPPNRVTINPAVRVRSRNDRRDYAPSRRSKSEGPPGTTKQRGYCAIYGSPSPDRADPPEFDAEYVYINNYLNDNQVDTTNVPTKHPRGNTEYRLQFAWPHSRNATEAHQEELKPAGGGSRRAAFMANVDKEKPMVPVHKKRNHDTNKKEGAVEVEPLVDLNGDCENHEDKKDKTPNQSVNGRIEFHSEYQKKFRPFSQYDYIAGKFLARDSSVTPSSHLATESWFAEVIELRKKAGEYRHRGWGTELVPQHLAEVYNKQIALWEHVSRRSSLSALTLATTTQKPRALTKAEKTKENNRKFRLNENRQQSVDRASTAIRKKTEKNDEVKRHSARTQKELNGKPAVNNMTSSTVPSARNQNTVNGSPKKGITRPASADSPKKSGSAPQEHQSRPTTLATNTHTRNIRDTSILARKKEPLKIKVSPAAANHLNDAKRNQSQSSKTDHNNKTDETDTIDSNKSNEPIIPDIERIIKSPPEPTRVKSPEQVMIKSPEPVNWTVPLDTGKTFTVTQNILDEDVGLHHHRPISEPKLLHHGVSHLVDTHDSITSKTDDATVSVSSCDLPSDKLSDKEVEGPEHVNGTEKSFSETISEESVKPLPVVTEEKLNAIELSGPMSIMNIPDEPISSDELKSSLMIPSRPPDIPEESSIASSPSPTSSVPIADRISSVDVLDSGRNRFDQFWNKPALIGNGKEMNGQDSSV